MTKYYRENKDKWASRRIKRRLEINEAKKKKYREDEATREYYKKNTRKWVKDNPRKALNLDLMTAYGITVDQYEEMLNSQNGSCAICGKDNSQHKRKKRLFVDHCHKTGKVRGLLCCACNFGLGSFSDDPELCIKASEYLKNRC
jgi:hypothetical protein